MAELTFYTGMPDAEMHSILEASCGVKDCTITAQALSVPRRHFHVQNNVAVGQVMPPTRPSPTYLPTGGQRSRLCGRTYLPTPTDLHSGQLRNVKKDQTQGRGSSQSCCPTDRSRPPISVGH